MEERWHSQKQYTWRQHSNNNPGTYQYLKKVSSLNKNPMIKIMTTHTHTNKQTNRQTNKHTNKQPHKQTNTHTHTHTHTHIHTYTYIYMIYHTYIYI